MADGDSRRLALTSQKYTLKSLILKDTPSGRGFGAQRGAMGPPGGGAAQAAGPPTVKKVKRKLEYILN